jgi:hypothetical protein
VKQEATPRQELTQEHLPITEVELQRIAAIIRRNREDGAVGGTGASGVTPDANIAEN